MIWQKSKYKLTLHLKIKKKSIDIMVFSPKIVITKKGFNEKPVVTCVGKPGILKISN